MIWFVIVLVVFIAADQPSTTSPLPRRPRVVIETSLGSFTAELDPRGAPETVARFLARAGLGPVPASIKEVAPYAGSQLCESRAHGYLVFGCVPFSPGPLPPKAPQKEGPAPDEIDGRAMGLNRDLLDDEKVVQWLWQREVFPRYMNLRTENKPVPPGLARLVEAVRGQGTEAVGLLRGKSRLWYLEAMGYQYTAGRSAARVTRGALVTVNLWPGEADERFLVALADLPERDGRATVFGHVVDGWDILDRIQAVPVDKSHRTREPVLIARITERKRE